VRGGAQGGGVGGGGSGGSKEWRRGESERSLCSMLRVGMGVGDEGGRGRSRSYTAARRDCWCRR
jgi:hypothetical protein